MTPTNSSSPMAKARRMTIATVMRRKEVMESNGNGNDVAISEEVKIMELPEELIYEIFSWLPAKSIFKFKSCSKSIFEFTNKTSFALKQAQNLMLKDDDSFFVQGKIFAPNNFFINRTEFHALPGNKTSSGIPTNFLRFLDERSVRILTSSNGLLLGQIKRQSTPKIELFICNPVTQSFSTIPTPHNLGQHPYTKAMFAFEFNHNNKGVHNEDYQLILFECGVGERLENIVYKDYIPKEGVWKENDKILLKFDDKIRIHDPPLFYKGTVHFISSWEITSLRIKYHYMTTYNPESGKTRIASFPKEVATIGYDFFLNYQIHIFKWGKVGGSNESICVVSLVKGVIFNLWILDDYESCSWSKFMTLSLEEMGLDENCIANGFIIINGDSLVINTQRGVYKYSLIGAGEGRLEEICKHELYWDSVRFIPYSNAFRSCRVD